MLPTLARLAKLPMSVPFKRGQTGLYHGQLVLSGNSVPHSKHKTRRTWLPNVHRKRLTLRATGEEVQIKVTSKALKTIKKKHAGSLDSYLLKTDPRLLGWTGLLLRARANASYASTARADDKFRDEYEAGLRRQAELDALVADELARLDAEDEAGEALEGAEAETEASEAPRV